MSFNADYSVRALTPDDWLEYSIIRLDALKNNPTAFLSSYEKEKNRKPEEWQKVICGANKQFTGLYYQGNLVGITGVVEWNDDDAPEPVGAIVANYVKPEHRGKSLSSLMYRECIDFAVNLSKWKKIIVTHREGNEASRRTIENQGFRFKNKISMMWHDNVRADECIYEIDLEQFRRNNPKTIG